MADFMRIGGIVQIIGGILLGILMGNMDGWLVGFYWWIAGMFGGIVFIAISLLFEAIGRIEHNLYNLTNAYFTQNPDASKPPKALGSSRSSLSKMSNYQMGRTEE